MQVKTNSSAREGLLIIAGKGGLEVTKTYIDNYYNVVVTLYNVVEIANKKKKYYSHDR